ncbi:MAG: erythromycin esterase family protein [Saprospiraceae bacterium]|nr:erythromycin esterase family protein [Saprospiraceae bacterium]
MKHPFLSLLLFCLLFVACKKESNLPKGSSPCTPTEEQTAIIESLNAQIDTFSRLPIGTQNPDLKELVDYLAEATVVGLGEGTHGTREFYQMKHHLFRQLVMEHDFKAIVFELPWGNALVINDYVVHGIGSAGAGLDQSFYWTYNTKEVEELVEWMRNYNNNLPLEDRIHFVGCDPQGPDFAKERSIIAQFLIDAEIDSASSITNRYATLPSGNLSDYSNASSEIHQQNAANCAWVIEYFEAKRDELIANSDAPSFELARMAADVIQARESLYRQGTFGTERDELMARYTRLWQEFFGKKVAAWAHNYHVMDGSAIQASWMGNHLRNHYQEQYRNLAFTFGKGSLNAFVGDAQGQFLRPVERQTLENPACTTVNYVLNEVNGSQHFLIFDRLDEPAAFFFTQKQAVMQCGAGFNPNYLLNYIQELPLARVFDVLIHYDETEASRLR